MKTKRFTPKKYRVLSPEGFDTNHNNTLDEGQLYSNIKQVKAEIKRFTEQYKTQGYYSQICYNGYRRHIALSDLPDYCEIVVL